MELLDETVPTRVGLVVKHFYPVYFCVFLVPVFIFLNCVLNNYFISSHSGCHLEEC